MLKAIVYRGQDVTDSVVDFREGGQPGRLQVILTNRVTALSGNVQDGSGRSIAEYEVQVFPQDREKLAPPWRRMRSVKPDQQGIFKVEGLPPGDYLAIAMLEIDDEQRFEPEYLERLRAQATSFAIAEGETKTLALKLAAPVQ
jgi:hypothetical protein